MSGNAPTEAAVKRLRPSGPAEVPLSQPPRQHQGASWAPGSPCSPTRQLSGPRTRGKCSASAVFGGQRVQLAVLVPTVMGHLAQGAPPPLLGWWLLARDSSHESSTSRARGRGGTVGTATGAYCGLIGLERRRSDEGPQPLMGCASTAMPPPLAERGDAAPAPSLPLPLPTVSSSEELP